MNTEAGKIQGNTWSRGIPDSYTVKWGNYDVDDPDGATPTLGTDTYKSYLEALMVRFHEVLPESLQKLPALPSTGSWLLPNWPVSPISNATASAVMWASKAAFIADLAAPDDTFFQETITNGRPGTSMPQWGGLMSPQQIEEVTAFLRSKK